MQFKLSKYVYISPPIDGKEEPSAKRMLYSLRKGMGVTVTGYALQLVREGNFAAIPDGLFSTLMYHDLILPADEEELEEIVIKNQLAAADMRANEYSVRLTCEADIVPLLPVLQIREWLQAATPPAIKKKQLRITLEARNLEAAGGQVEAVHDQVDKAGLLASCQPVFQLESGTCTNWDYPEQILSATTIKLDHIILQPEVIREAHTAIRMHDMLLALEEKLISGSLLAAVNFHITVTVTSEYETLLPLLMKSLTALRRYRQVTLLVQLSQEEQESTGTFFLKEKELLKYLDAQGLFLNLLPVKLPCEYRKGDNGTHHYDPGMVASLLTGKSFCATCSYLPLCGGEIDKQEGYNDNCPAFIHNFPEKVYLKYNIPLSS
ncbi:hypothetical protein [Chitinophaga sp. MM2321]|uniref:hypothetical protein n=1 Tax=Chitinophaga sp. MM2321 TaxID=3137178 RepID=UPI0032D56AAA